MEEGTREPPRFGLITLFFAFVLLLVIYPLASELDANSMIIHAAFTILLTACLYLMTYHRAVFILGICLYVPVIVCKWLGAAFPKNDVLMTFEYVLSFLFLALAAIVIQWMVCCMKKISYEVGLGLILTYLLIGIFFFEIYCLLQYFQAGSFQGARFYNQEEELLYYSYLTLTTLGYGEVLASSVTAKFLSVIEAVIGQMFIVLAFARALTKYLKQGKI